jgi:hypothetical protein
MSTAVGFCPHCKGMRNMRATQETGKGMGADREIIVTHHCETCGLFVESEAFRKASQEMTARKSPLRKELRMSAGKPDGFRMADTQLQKWSLPCF